jgi:hypothetical protein
VVYVPRRQVVPKDGTYSIQLPICFIFCLIYDVVVLGVNEVGYGHWIDIGRLIRAFP